MAVVQISKADAIASAAATNPEPVVTYFSVVLSTRKDLFGHTYKPGIPHTVDKATLDALGDAVAEKKQIKA